MVWLIVGIAAAIVIPIMLLFLSDYEKLGTKEKKKLKAICFITSMFCLIGGIFASMAIIVPAGTVGVHDLLGNVAEAEYPAGFSFKNPFAHMEMMSIKTHEIKERSEVPSKEGLLVILDVSVLFRIQPNHADEIYKKLGTEYWNVIIKPQLRSVIREVTASYEAKALYTTGRLNITTDIFNSLYPKLIDRGIILERVLLRDLGLPSKLIEAIELKLTAEQQIEQKEFEVARESQEAERKRVEARGIADANDIIALSLTENYLRWYWIENLDTHSSVIYVPVGSGGMPIFKEVQSGIGE